MQKTCGNESTYPITNQPVGRCGHLQEREHAPTDNDGNVLLRRFTLETKGLRAGKTAFIVLCRKKYQREGRP